MEKKILILLNDEPKEYLLVKKNTNIKSIKSFLEKYNYDLIQFYINNNIETKVFDTNKYDNLTLESVWKEMKKPAIYLSTKTGFMNLPPDMKRRLIEEVEPPQVLTLCETVKCDWKKLLDVNYDFITQGFTIGKTDEEKFRYLAERVSKNVGVEQPEIIFFHKNGIPLGKKMQNEIIESEDLEHIGSEIKYMKDELKNNSAIEWVKQDDYNMWVKVKRHDFLPTEFKIVIPPDYVTKMSNVDFYDYPETRKEIMEIENDVEYPGKVYIDKKVIKSMINKFFPDEKTKEEMDSAAEEYKEEMDLEYVNPEYHVYTIMRDDEFSRSEAEVLAKTIKEKGSFTKNLKKLYGYKI